METIAIWQQLHTPSVIDHSVNSLWPSDIHIVSANRAPSHCLIQFWLIINNVLGNHLDAFSVMMLLLSVVNVFMKNILTFYPGAKELIAQINGVYFCGYDSAECGVQTIGTCNQYHWTGLLLLLYQLLNTLRLKQNGPHFPGDISLN